jgi:hypothetical protein
MKISISGRRIASRYLSKLRDVLSFEEVVKVIDIVKEAGAQPIGLQIEGVDQ